MSRKQFSEIELANLALRFRKGDTNAFADLYDYYIDNIYRFIYFKVKSEDAEDLTEITFIKVWENREKFDPDKSSFSSWVYTIARNTVIDHYRVSKVSEELTPDLADHNPDTNPKQTTEQNLSSENLRKAINKLQPNFRDLLLLRFIEDLEYPEIARILGKTEGSIRIMQFRAIKELRNVLQKMGFDE